MEYRLRFMRCPLIHVDIGKHTSAFCFSFAVSETIFSEGVA